MSESTSAAQTDVLFDSETATPSGTNTYVSQPEKFSLKFHVVPSTSVNVKSSATSPRCWPMPDELKAFTGTFRSAQSGTSFEGGGCCSTGSLELPHAARATKPMAAATRGTEQRGE